LTVQQRFLNTADIRKHPCNTSFTKEAQQNRSVSEVKRMKPGSFAGPLGKEYVCSEVAAKH